MREIDILKEPDEVKALFDTNHIMCLAFSRKDFMVQSAKISPHQIGFSSIGTATTAGISRTIGEQKKWSVNASLSSINLESEHQWNTEILLRLIDKSGESHFIKSSVPLHLTTSLQEGDNISVYGYVNEWAEHITPEFHPGWIEFLAFNEETREVIPLRTFPWVEIEIPEANPSDLFRGFLFLCLVVVF